MSDVLAKIQQIITAWIGAPADIRAFTICLLIFIPLVLVYCYLTYKEAK